MKNYKFPSVSYELADMIEKKSGAEVRVVVPGHTKEAEVRVRMTAFFAAVWVRQQHRRSWMRIMAT